MARPSQRLDSRARADLPQVDPHDLSIALPPLPDALQHPRNPILRGLTEAIQRRMGHATKVDGPPNDLLLPLGRRSPLVILENHTRAQDDTRAVLIDE